MKSGVILYQGPSQLDGAPIVVIATFRSHNEKTGAMIQTWILRADVDPLTASRQAKDASVCGVCPQRQNLGGACYVILANAPLTVWKAWKRGVYEKGELPSGQALRMGSYGDPCAVPLEVWRRALNGRRWTGYTHQWETFAHASEYREILMASCDDAPDAARAQAAGWRTFTVGAAPVRSVECLADARGMTCAECSICDGTRGNERRASVWIAPHGGLAKRHLTMMTA